MGEEIRCHRHRSGRLRKGNRPDKAGTRTKERHRPPLIAFLEKDAQDGKKKRHKRGCDNHNLPRATGRKRGRIQASHSSSENGRKKRESICNPGGWGQGEGQLMGQIIMGICWV